MNRRGRRCSRLLAALLASAAIHGADLAVLEAGSTAQLTALGNEALMQGRYETAIDLYKRALGADKGYFSALYNLALAHQQLGQYPEAKRWYGEALRVKADHPEVYCNLGYLAFRAGEWATASDRFLEAARLSASNPVDAADYWYNAGTAREKLGQFADAQRAYEEAIALNDRHFGAHFNLGTLLLGPLAERADSLEHAAANLQKAVKIAPNRPEGWLNQAICLERLGQDPLPAYAEAIKVATGPGLNRARWQRALFHNRCQPPRRLAVRDDLKAILADDPDFPEANGLLGTYYFAIGEYDQALVHLAREVAGANFDANSSTDLEAHYLLALIYTDHRPDPAKALAHATAYYQQRPDSQKIHELRRRALRLTTKDAK